MTKPTMAPGMKEHPRIMQTHRLHANQLLQSPTKKKTVLPRLQICSLMSMRQYVISDLSNMTYKQVQDGTTTTPSVVGQH